jgi:2-amino-4-hydroxy-6-hydroxymethyldihydropteridine diphosphokinase
MATVYIALGSNVGDRKTNLHEAVSHLENCGVRVVKVSSFYETEPVDYLDQPWFLNAVLEATTELSPAHLLAAMRGIESQMGSKKPFAKGPRLIDLDILLFGDQIVESAELQVPHPRMLQRNFVLVPLAEIAPEVQHPSWPGPAKEMLANSPDTSVVRKYAQ